MNNRENLHVKDLPSSNVEESKSLEQSLDKVEALNEPEARPRSTEEVKVTLRDKIKLLALREELCLEKREVPAVLRFKDTYKLQGKELADFRQVQPRGSKLSEYLTGMRPDDPQLVERLIEDQKIIREKYALPDMEVRIKDPTEYERRLRKISDELGVKIRERSDSGEFFNKTSAGGVYIDEYKQIGIDVDKSTLDTYDRSLNVLEHELIHALQYVKSPRMPIELMEYEAYIANGNMGYLRENPEMVGKIFSSAIGYSVDVWYEHASKKQNSPMRPEWESPEYFLKKDGLLDGE